MTDPGDSIRSELEGIFAALAQVLEAHRPRFAAESVGTITFVGPGVVRIAGLAGVRAEELIRFPRGRLGLAFDIDRSRTGAVFFDESEELEAGQEVRRTGRVLDVAVGEGLIGRVVDGLGRPLDARGPVAAAERRPVERSAPGIMDRRPVTVPLQTGLKVVDALIPIGRGQRELVLGDRQTGKTAIAVDTIINQRGRDVLCIYCAVGKRASAAAKVIDDLARRGAMEHTVVMVTTEENPPGLQFVCPYAAMTIGEYFMERGRDVLVVFDDLTRHARAYREVSLLLRRPPGREAFPGDIFYIHSRLLERSTRLKDALGGGSLSALPIVETEAQNISAYIPTNLISITDGQIYLSPELFQKGSLPAVDVGKSVSRVGGRTQLPAYRSVAGDLRLAYSQFEELEAFSRFGTGLDEETRRTLTRGRRVRAILKQPQSEPLSVSEQIAALVAVNEGVLDGLPAESVAEAERRIRGEAAEKLPEICRKMEEGAEATDEMVASLKAAAERAVEGLRREAEGKKEEAEEDYGRRGEPQA